MIAWETVEMVDRLSNEYPWRMEMLERSWLFLSIILGPILPIECSGLGASVLRVSMINVFFVIPGLFFFLPQ